MQALFRTIPPKKGQPQSEAKELTVTARYDLPTGLGHINKFSDSPCPKGCAQVRAYSMGRHSS